MSLLRYAQNFQNCVKASTSTRGTPTSTRFVPSVTKLAKFRGQKWDFHARGHPDPQKSGSWVVLGEVGPPSPSLVSMLKSLGLQLLPLLSALSIPEMNLSIFGDISVWIPCFPFICGKNRMRHDKFAHFTADLRIQDRARSWSRAGNPNLQHPFSSGWCYNKDRNLQITILTRTAVEIDEDEISFRYLSSLCCKKAIQGWRRTKRFDVLTKGCRVFRVMKRELWENDAR